MSISIQTASTSHLNELAIIFDQYRVFYKQPTDLIKAEAFLKERISKNESVIFIAYLDDRPVGFTQLYPTFSSVSMESFYILNDLFVNENVRGKGIGKILLKHAQSFAKNQNQKGLALSTEIDNPAQYLYEKLDWKKDLEFFSYFWKC